MTIRKYFARITRPKIRRVRRAVATAVLAGSIVPALCGQAVNPPLAGASLEDLLNINVTSVSKKDQTLARTGAAVFVINREDIRRSGASNIPDLLRMVPGVEVAQINANQWAVSIRGFNNVNSDKVLVLIDGRTAYVDTFSGVYWDQIDVPLEDIERIEVIRGPGGTVWGANAVNGVINIITRSAADTKGAVMVTGTGSAQRAQELLQYGSDAGSTGAYRIFGKYFDSGDSPLPGGGAAADGWHTWHAGFRSDWGLTTRDTLSVQGDFVSGTGGEPAAVAEGVVPLQTPTDSQMTNRSGDILGKWEHALANGSTTSLQLYDSAFERNEADVRVSDDTIDVEFEHHLAAGSRNDLVWGVDYRFTRDGIRPLTSEGRQTNLPEQSVNLFAAFAQDEIRIAKSVFLTVGSKIEHNSYTGFEFEPSVQFVWEKSAHQSFWSSASRAIREPNAVENYVNDAVGSVPIPGAGNATLVLEGNPLLRAEQLTGYEAGYRAQINRRLSVDATSFLNFYRRLETHEEVNPYASASGSVIIPLQYANLARASDYGFEFFANWQVSDRWKLSPDYSTLRLFVARDAGSNDATVTDAPGDSPKQQFEIRSALDLRRNIELDCSLKYVAALAGQNVPGYVQPNIRIGWRIGTSLELSLSGQNLAGPRHFEFLDDSGLFGPAEVARSIFGSITLRGSR